jgi:hypothetical protein
MKEIQIKITLVFHLTTVIMAIIKKVTKQQRNDGKDLGGGKEPLYTVGGDVN